MPLFLCVAAASVASGCGDASEASTGRQVLEPHVRAATVTAATERPESRHRLLLQPRREASVAARYGGAVRRLDVTEQAQVKAGDPLVSLVDTDARGALRSAKASVAAAREQLEDNERVRARSERLESRGAESSREVERLASTTVSLRSSLEQSRGSLTQAQDRMDATTVRAPFDGTVLDLPVEPGEFAPMGGTVAVVADLSTLAVEVPLSEAEAVAQERGTLVFEVKVRGEVAPHEVEWVSRAARTDTGRFVARLLVSASVGLRAGETADVRVVSPQGPRRPAVPAGALRWDGPRPYIFVLEPGEGRLRRVRRVDVEVVGDLGSRVAIEARGDAPLSEGVEVVAAGPDNLVDEDAVVVVETPRSVTAPSPARAEPNPMGSTADANPKDDAAEP